MIRDYRDFRFVLLGAVFNQSGQWILNLSLGWLMLELTDSAFMVGLIGFAAGLPVLVISIPTGAIIDRSNRRTILLVAQATLMLTGATLALLVIAGIVAPWQLLVGAVLNGSLMAVTSSTRQTIVPNVVTTADLPGAIGTLSAGQHTARILGPSFAGIIIGFVGIAGAFLFQAAVLAVALLMTLPLSSAVARRRSSGQATGRISEGLRYVVANPLILSLILLGAFPMFFAFPYLTLLPVFARDVLDIGPDGLGLLMAASGVGAVTGGLMTSPVAGHVRRIGLFIIFGMMFYSLVLSLFSLSSIPLLAAVFLASSSATSSLSISLDQALLQMHVEDELRGRVTGVMMLTSGLFSIGALPMGFVASQVGVQSAVIGGAAISAACVAILGLRSESLRALRRT